MSYDNVTGHFAVFFVSGLSILGVAQEVERVVH